MTCLWFCTDTSRFGGSTNRDNDNKKSLCLSLSSAIFYCCKVLNAISETIGLNKRCLGNSAGHFLRSNSTICHNADLRDTGKSTLCHGLQAMSFLSIDRPRASFRAVDSSKKRYYLFLLSIQTTYEWQHAWQAQLGTWQGQLPSWKTMGFCVIVMMFTRSILPHHPHVRLTLRAGTRGKWHVIRLRLPNVRSHSR